MTKKVKVTKVEIDIGDSKHTMSLAQARELRDVLNEAFPEDRPAPIIIHDWSRPYRYWDPVWVTSPSWISSDGTTTTSNFLSITANTAAA